jgi:hypothetical protein
MIPQSQLRFNGDCMVGGPSDLIMALGKDGQQIQVSPSENMVWIRMGEAPDSKTPLVNFSLGAEIWDKINQLKCNSTDVDAIENSIPRLRFPNPIRRGEALNLFSDDSNKTLNSNSNGNAAANANPNPKAKFNNGPVSNTLSITLVDALGRVYPLQSDLIPFSMATGVYQLRVGNVTSRVVIVD